MYIELIPAIEWTVRIVSVCILIDTIEKVYNFREFLKTGIFDWAWVRRNPVFSEKRRIIRVFADAVFGFRIWFPLVALRGLAAAGLLFWAGNIRFRLIGLLVLFVVGSLENFRRTPFFQETPNRFTLTVIGALILQGLVPTEFVSAVCMWFIALQSCLSYATAGISKLFNKDWRKGEGLLKAFNAPNYAISPGLAKIFDRFKRTGKSVNYLTIAAESLFPLVLIVGSPYFWVFLVWGAFLHLTNAVVLRLNNYFWTWIATYPAIIYVAQH